MNKIKKFWNEIKIIPTIGIPTAVAIHGFYKTNNIIGAIVPAFFLVSVLLLLFWWKEL